MSPPTDSHFAQMGPSDSKAKIRPMPINTQTRFADRSISESSTDSNSPMINVDSTSSVNSLFDNVTNTHQYSRSTTTSTSPILSRNQLSYWNTNSFTNPSSLSKLTESEFSSLVNQKLLQSQQPEKLIIMLSGLPASGKSTTSKQLKKYINDHTKFTAEIYNAGNVRRMNKNFDNSDFFDPNNVQGKLDRELYADITINNLIHDLNSNVIQVGFLDATNTTVARRQRMMSIMAKNTTNTWIAIMDVECNDKKLLHFNINGKAHNKDYQNKNYIESIKDFNLRTKHYYKVFEPITCTELQGYPISIYMKVINGGETFKFSSIDPEFEESLALFTVLSDFCSKYFEMEGKRYFEAVDAFYNSETMINELEAAFD